MSTPQRHESYNNRFRRSSTLSSSGTSIPENAITSVSTSLDIFGQPTFGSLNLQQYLDGHALPRQDSHEQPQAVASPLALDASGGALQQPPRPLAPGKPRRLSRQLSADARRQMFSGARQDSTGHCNVTSVESVDDVFLEAGTAHAPSHQYTAIHQPALFQGARKSEPVLSTSSTTTMLPNPYNRLNHRLHSMIWCCGCLYFVFFCCLPAIHYMEHSDIEYNQGDHKKARQYGRASTFLFFSGTLLTLSIFALVFFLAIFFTVYG